MAESRNEPEGDGAEAHGDASRRTSLAQERTAWAAQRTVLANERTFSAWLRTGLTAIAAGLAVSELLGDGAAGWLARAIGILLILIGAGISLLALWRFHHLSMELKERRLPALPPWVGLALALSVVFIALLVLVLLILR